MPLNRREFLFRGAGFATVSAMVPRFPILGTRYLEESVAAGGASRVLVVVELAGRQRRPEHRRPVHGPALQRHLPEDDRRPGLRRPRPRREARLEPGDDGHEVALGRRTASPSSRASRIPTRTSRTSRPATSGTRPIRRSRSATDGSGATPTATLADNAQPARRVRDLAVAAADAPRRQGRVSRRSRASLPIPTRRTARTPRTPPTRSRVRRAEQPSSTRSRTATSGSKASRAMPRRAPPRP